MGAIIKFINATTKRINRLVGKALKFISEFLLMKLMKININK